MRYPALIVIILTCATWPATHAEDGKREDAKAHFNLGVSLDAKGDTEGAIKEFRRVLEIMPSNVTARNNLAAMLGKSGDTGGAIKEFRRVLEIEPDNDLAKSNLEVAIKNKRDTDNPALKIKSEEANAHMVRGFALDVKEDNDGAIKEFRRASELEPDNARTHRVLGTALRKNGDNDGAIKELRRALEISPNDVDTKILLGTVLSRIADYDGAIKEYRDVLKLKPKSVEADSCLINALNLKIGAFFLKEDYDAAWKAVNETKAAGDFDKLRDSTLESLRKASGRRE